MPDDALIAAADELYALAPSDFTAARNSRARAVRGDDRALSESIRALKKPTPAAWLVNQLVRHRTGELREVLDLGDELRDAQDRRDGPELSRLTRTRRTAVAELGREAAALADELGASVGRPTLDEVEQTVTAGIADAAATDAVLSGRLLRALMTVGFDPVDLDGAVAGGPAPVAQPMRPVEDIAVRREKKRREQAANEADKAAASARRALDDAEGKIATAERRREEAEHDRDDLEERLRLATKKLTAAEEDLSAREDERDKAAAALKRADSVAQAARAELDEH